ncbi:MAG: exodeoxyribonuclease VII small subunit [Oscillospiraceae bacterium]|nr:exodeoxyribonuclease VII small subunit [Oscillospiraceae bacterium]
MATKTKQPTFEEGLEQLEQIVTLMETGELSLADTLEKYEQGVKLAKGLKDMLDYSEKQLVILKAKQQEDARPSEEE